MAKYQGYKNWNHWNVSLWLFNDEDLYRRLHDTIRVTVSLDHAAEVMVRFLPYETPDGAPYTYTSVRAAIAGWEG